MTSVTYEEGKVYLKDTRNGVVYPYEKYLALDKNFVAVVPNPVPAPVALNAPQVVHTPVVTVNANEHPAPAPD